MSARVYTWPSVPRGLRCRVCGCEAWRHELQRVTRMLFCRCVAHGLCAVRDMGED